MGCQGKCFMFPIYSADGQLLGWQEKSKGYFMNVPLCTRLSPRWVAHVQRRCAHRC